MKFKIAFIAAAFALSTPASADVQIQPFSQSLFSGCVVGQDIGALTKVSNPLLLLGSIVYTGDVLTPEGPKKGLVRQPLALPITTSDSVSPDISTCEHNFSVSSDGNVSFLGFALDAKKSDIYKVRVRLVTRQKVSPVAQSGALVQPWFSTTWKPLFKQVTDAADPAVDKFYIFDNISIYLLDVEKYKKVGGGLSGAFGLFTGGANYARDDTFKGTKLIVTGDTVPLTRAMFGPAPALAAGIPDASQALLTLSGTEATALQSQLSASER